MSLANFSLSLRVGMMSMKVMHSAWKIGVKKLEFTGPVTSGNAIKTVYAANIVGRFMAADNGTELRESMTKDLCEEACSWAKVFLVLRRNPQFYWG